MKLLPPRLTVRELRNAPGTRSLSPMLFNTASEVGVHTEALVFIVGEPQALRASMARTPTAATPARTLATARPLCRDIGPPTVAWRVHTARTRHASPPAARPPAPRRGRVMAQ